MFKLPKLESRISFITFFRRKNYTILINVIYRAGYVEDIVLNYVKELNDDILSNLLKKSKHYAQVRYYVIKTNNKNKINFYNVFTKLGKPLILVIKNKIGKIGLSDKEYQVLNERSYILDGLNTLNIINRSIKRYYVAILPEL